MLNFAIIGCGRISRLHAERLQADGRGRVAALYDADLQAAEALRGIVPADPVVCSTLEELLAAPLDGAIVCTPTAAHFDQVVACRQRGLHVLCEKPLADTRERILKLVDSSLAGGPRLSVAYQRRYWSRYRTLRREVQSGRWGKMQSVSSRAVENWQQTIGGTWRDDPDVNAGGFIADAGSHKIDGVFYVTGLKPVEVFAHTDQCGSQVEIAAMISARLEGDVPLAINFVGNAQYLGEDLHVHCAEADLMIRDEQLWIGRRGRVEPFDDLEPESNPVSGFIDLIEENGPDVAPPECAVPVFDFTRAILESGRTRSVVRL